ncbi:MAG: YdcF family protein [Elusimicrobia bacterium]|nr:YdcF family protein [Elusimicrobiota bacterium]
MTRPSRRFHGWKLAALAVLPAAFAACAAAPFLVGWWMDYSDEPRRSDLLVVLSGSEYGRAVYGARLYADGYAPEVWLTRPRMAGSVRLANSLGVKVPAEDEVMFEILVRQGVPRGRIRRYGSDVASTVGEARALRDALGREGRSVLAVTSRYHARRARMILGRALPGSAVRVVATPHDGFTRRWWTDRDLARAGILETAKVLYYLAGGAF